MARALHHRARLDPGNHQRAAFRGLTSAAAALLIACGPQSAFAAERSPLVTPDREPSLTVKQNGEAARAHGSFESRHLLGFQLGGTGVFQLAYRARTIDRLHLEVGLGGLNRAFNVSTGLLHDIWLGDRTAAYVGAGGGVLGIFRDDSCPAEGESAQCATTSIWAFGYLRAGFALHLGNQDLDVVGFDLGMWHGRSFETGPMISRDAPFTWPMVGVSYHRVIDPTVAARP